MAHVLFVCLHNAGRSQMGRALFDRAARGRHTADSAGSVADPDGTLHPEVVTAMRELGVDLSGRRPTRLTDALAARADLVVTMGCGDSCPVAPGSRRLDWDLADPKGRSASEVRAIRDEIARRVTALLDELDRTSDEGGAGGPQAIITTSPPPTPTTPGGTDMGEKDAVRECTECGRAAIRASEEEANQEVTHCEWCGAEYPVPEDD